MGRAHIEFIEAPAVAKEDVADGPFAGGIGRLLSKDDESGAYTALSSFPADWSADLSGFDRPVEIFALEGALAIDGRRLGAGCYAYVPAGSRDARLTVREPTHALVMVEPEASCQNLPVEVVDQATLPWQRAATTAPDNPAPEGIVIKLLRVHPESGDWTWLVTVVPGFLSQRVEVHPTVEECFMLRGDILNGERGVMGSGSYFWRPPMVEHGPMYSQNGGLFFSRSKGGGLSTTFSEFPGWEKKLEAYAAAAFFTGHID